MNPKTDRPSKVAKEAWAALVAADSQVPFGPLFFLEHLRGLIRDRCPEPAEGLPSVCLHVVDGDVLDLCHIIGIGPRWIALAVNEAERHAGTPPMRTELVPYGMIARVTIGAARLGDSPHIGFDLDREPKLVHHARSARTMTPEDALRAVAGSGTPNRGALGDPHGTKGRLGRGRGARAESRRYT